MSVRKIVILLSAVLISAIACFVARVTFFSLTGPIIVDYCAFVAGIFLVSEGLWAIVQSKEETFRICFFRLFRIAIGICIFTIHFLQFIRDGKLGA